MRLQAAILGAKLPHLEEWTEQRRAAAARYNDLLSGYEVVTPAERPYNRHVYYCYVIRTPRRDGLSAHLAAQGIDTVVHYPHPDAPAAGLPGDGLGRAHSRSPRRPPASLSLPDVPGDHTGTAAAGGRGGAEFRRLTADGRMTTAEP